MRPRWTFVTFKTQKVTFKLLYSQQYIYILFWQVSFLQIQYSLSLEAVLSRSSNTHRLRRWRPDSAVFCGTRPCWSRPCCWEPALPPAWRTESEEPVDADTAETTIRALSPSAWWSSCIHRRVSEPNARACVNAAERVGMTGAVEVAAHSSEELTDWTCPRKNERHTDAETCSRWPFGGYFILHIKKNGM